MRLGPRGCPNGFGLAGQRPAGLARRPGPRGCPAGFAIWLPENAPALAEAVTAPRKIDMCAPCSRNGRGGEWERAGGRAEGGRRRGREGALCQTEKIKMARMSQDESFATTGATMRVASKLYEAIPCSYSDPPIHILFRTQTHSVALRRNEILSRSDSLRPRLTRTQTDSYVELFPLRPTHSQPDFYSYVLVHSHTHTHRHPDSLTLKFDRFPCGVLPSE